MIQESSMKCLVFSDSHESCKLMRDALLVHRDAEVVFFLGDGLSDAERVALDYPDRAWIVVRGNCDYGNTFRGREVLKVEKITLDGVKIVLTHGDLYCAKYTMGVLKGLAVREGADILLFGHTHTAMEEYVSDSEHPFYLFNPGAASGYHATYGIIDITQNGIMLSHGGAV